MYQQELDLTAARAARDDGIARAVEHADEEAPSWSDVALAYLRYYASHHDQFLTENVRWYAEGRGLAAPPDRRAWGGVARRACREGIVAKTGRYQPMCSINCHASPKQVWRSLVFRAVTDAA